MSKSIFVCRFKKKVESIIIIEFVLLDKVYISFYYFLYLLSILQSYMKNNPTTPNPCHPSNQCVLKDYTPPHPKETYLAFFCKGILFSLQ